jgi:hypothetical protein
VTELLRQRNATVRLAANAGSGSGFQHHSEWPSKWLNSASTVIAPSNLKMKEDEARRVETPLRLIGEGEARTS